MANTGPCHLRVAKTLLNTQKKIIKNLRRWCYWISQLSQHYTDNTQSSLQLICQLKHISLIVTVSFLLILHQLPFSCNRYVIILGLIMTSFFSQQAIFACFHFARIAVIFRFYSWLSFQRLRRLYGTVLQSTAANCITYVDNAYAFFWFKCFRKLQKHVFKYFYLKIYVLPTNSLSHTLTDCTTDSSRCHVFMQCIWRKVTAECCHMPPHSIVATVAKLTEQSHSRGLELLTVNQHQ